MSGMVPEEDLAIAHVELDRLRQAVEEALTAWEVGSLSSLADAMAALRRVLHNDGDE